MRRLLVLAASLALGAAACAPDLTIGPATTTTNGGSGGTGTTSTGGGGGGTGGASGGTGGTGGTVAPGTVQWAVNEVFEGDQIVYGASSDTNGRIYLAVADLTAASTYAESITITHFEEGGTAFGGSYLGGDGPHVFRAVVGGQDEAYYVGDLLGATSYDVPDIDTPVSAGGSDCLVAYASTNIGWTRAIGTEGYSSCAGVAVVPEGVLVAGTFSGTLDDTFLDGANEPIVSKGDGDLFVARFKVDGTPEIARQFGDAHDQRAIAMGHDAMGNLYVLAEDDGPVGSAGSDIVLLRLDKDGTLLETRRYGTLAEEHALALAVAPDGTTAIAGTVIGSIDLGGGAIGGDAFVAVFDPKGNHVWSHSLSAPGGLVHPRALLFGDDKSLYMGGDFYFALEFAGVSLEGQGGTDAIVARFDPAGALVWNDTFANGQDETIGGLTMTKSGTLVAAGHYTGDLPVDIQVLETSDAADWFVVGIQP